MAGPIADKIILPLDTGNTGKKVRTQTRVVGADTVHEHFFIKNRQAQILGVYRVAMPQQTVLAAAQNGTATGFLWAHVPISVTNKWARIRRFYCSSQQSSALATPTAPRLILQKFTFTGTASGAALTAGKIDSSVPTPVLDLRTAVTGLNVALDVVMGSVGIMGALTAVGVFNPTDLNILDSGESEDEWLIIKPGQGFVLYQDVAGTTSDTRKFNPVLLWDEVDVA